MEHKSKKEKKQVANKSVRPCLSYLLTIILDNLPGSLGNQPDKIQALFYHYYHQTTPAIFIADTVISSWKSGRRPFERNIKEFYESQSDEFLENFRQNIFPALEDPIEIAERFYGIISRSYDSQYHSSLDHYKEKALVRRPESFTQQDCSDFLAETLYYFMNHQEYVLKAGVTAPPPDFILGCWTAAPCRYFCGREKEMTALHALLQEQGYAFVTGFSGIGKSEFCRRYALNYSQDYASYYKYTLSVTFHDSLRNTIIHMPFSCDAEIRKRYEIRRDQIISSLGKNPEAFQKLQEELKDLERQLSEELFSTHDRLLSTLSPNTLLIIDNINIGSDQDPLLSHVLNYPCHILVTTQYNYSDYAHLELTEIQDSKVLIQLVASYFQEAGKYPEEIAEMISILHGHTLFIELCAKLLGMEAVRMQDLLEKLRIQKARLDADDPIKIRKDSVDISDTFHGFIRMLFPFFHLDQEEQYILTNLALFPIEGIQLIDFKEWMDLIAGAQASGIERTAKRRCISAIYNLLEKGLIQNRDGILSMHTLIQEVVVAEDEVTPSIKRCHSLLACLQSLCRDYCKNVEYPETIFMVLMNTVALAKKDEDAFYLSLLKDAYFAAVFQGYQPGIQVLSTELAQRLGPTGSPLDSLHESILHYIKACNAETPEEATSEYQAILDGTRSMPIGNILNPEIEPELSPFSKNMSMAAVKQLSHEVGPEGMENIKGQIIDEVNYLFGTPEGQKEYMGIMSGILGKITQIATAAMAGESTKLTGSDIIKLITPEKSEKK